MASAWVMARSAPAQVTASLRHITDKAVGMASWLWPGSSAHRRECRSASLGDPGLLAIDKVMHLEAQRKRARTIITAGVMPTATTAAAGGDSLARRL